MNDAENVGSATNTKKAKKEIVESQFIVKTEGYQETFRNQADAKNQYDLLKKRSVKNQDSIKLELTEIDSNGKKKTLENVTIGEDFFK